MKDRTRPRLVPTSMRDRTGAVERHRDDRTGAPRGYINGALSTQNKCFVVLLLAVITALRCMAVITALLCMAVIAALGCMAVIAASVCMAVIAALRCMAVTTASATIAHSTAFPTHGGDYR